LRGFANAQISACGARKEIEYILDAANDCGDDSYNNEVAIESTRLRLFLANGEMDQTRAVYKTRLEEFESNTGHFYGPLENLGLTIRTVLGFIDLSLLCECQLARSQKDRTRIRGILEALDQQRYGVKALINRFPEFGPNVTEAVRQIDGMHGFVKQRIFPRLSKNYVKLILDVARRLRLKVHPLGRLSTGKRFCPQCLHRG
jgi:hypothetical protein